MNRPKKKEGGVRLTRFNNAKQRCKNTLNPKYKYYGGKGIKFLLSRANMIEILRRDKPETMERPSIDRIDQSGHYAMENCRFIEMGENIKRSHGKERKYYFGEKRGGRKRTFSNGHYENAKDCPQCDKTNPRETANKIRVCVRCGFSWTY